MSLLSEVLTQKFPLIEKKRPYQISFQLFSHNIGISPFFFSNQVLFFFFGLLFCSLMDDKTPLPHSSIMAIFHGNQTLQKLKSKIFYAYELDGTKEIKDTKEDMF